MRIINAVGPATSSVSPSFPTTRVRCSPLFPALTRPIRFPVNKHFPFGSLSLSFSSSTLARDHRRNRIAQTNRFLIPLLSSLFFPPPSPSSSLFPFLRSSFYSLSVQHAASWNSGRRSSARHRITGHSRFRALEPKHARVVRLSWTSPRCNRGESVDQGLPRGFLPLRNRVCKTLFLDEFKRNVEEAATVITMTKTGTGDQRVGTLYVCGVEGGEGDFWLLLF